MRFAGIIDAARASMLDLRQYRSFVAVAEELHFGRAAARLHLAQPALTRQVQAMEAHLGIRLLQRTQRRVALTPAGSLLLDRARSILRAAAEAERDARRAAEGELGQLTIGFVHSATYGLLPDLLQRFRLACPGVELQLREMRTPEQIGAIAREAIDIGLIRPFNLPKEVEAAPIFEESFIVALPATHPLAGRGALTLLELAEQPFVMFSEHESPMFHSATVAMCERSGFRPRTAQEATHVHTVLGLVASGFGIAIVPDIVRRLSMANVAYATIADGPPPIQVLLAWSRSGRTPASEAFRRVAQSYLREGAVQRA
jgi:DNA-binding transcriptional LysR family regulator